MVVLLQTYWRSLARNDKSWFELLNFVSDSVNRFVVYSTSCVALSLRSG